MESLAEILQLVQEKNGFSDLIASLDIGEYEKDEFGFPKLPPLTVPEESAESLRQRLTANGFPPLYIDRSPSEYIRDDDNAAALEQVGKFLDNPKKGLYICGTFGTGKTWLATLIGRRMTERGELACFATLPKITDALMDVTNPERGVLRDRYTKNATLLVIDDIGKETPTKGRLDTLFEVLDAREKNNLLTIITSNYNLPELCARITPEKGESVTADAIKDRLRCYEAVLLGGNSRRSY